MAKDIRTKGHAGKIDEFLGTRLRLFRQIANLSQETLALSVGITFQQVQKYEKGTNRISAARDPPPIIESGFRVYSDTAFGLNYWRNFHGKTALYGGADYRVATSG